MLLKHIHVQSTWGLRHHNEMEGAFIQVVKGSSPPLFFPSPLPFSGPAAEVLPLHFGGSRLQISRTKQGSASPQSLAVLRLQCRAACLRAVEPWLQSQGIPILSWEPAMAEDWGDRCLSKALCVNVFNWGLPWKGWCLKEELKMFFYLIFWTIRTNRSPFRGEKESTPHLRKKVVLLFTLCCI